MQKWINAIDNLNEWVGRIACWIVIVLMLILVYEATARYVFNAPTQWAYDLAYMLYGAMFMLGVGYALKSGAHVRIDVFSRMFSNRTKAIIDIVAFAVVVIPVSLLLLVFGTEAAWHSFWTNERSAMSAWRPIMWPFKAILPIAMLLLSLQALSELLRWIPFLKPSPETTTRSVQQ